MNKAPKISIAMATYNGEKYVVKQLESILSQTRQPDEVIICDDGSNDETSILVRNFILSKHLNNWFLHINEINLGWKANFFKAISLTTGDIVFFSDQDDIWAPEKIEIMSSLMINKRMGALYATKNIINQNGMFEKSRQEIRTFSGGVSQIKLTSSFYELKTLGCCMCISREIADIYISIGFSKGDHDSQCGRLAVLCANLWYYDYPVINYRIHTNNTSCISIAGSFGQSTKTKRIEEIELAIEWLDILVNNLSITQEKKLMLIGCKEFLRNRLLYFSNKKSIFYLIRNKKYYTGITMLLGDIAYKYNLNKSLGKSLWRIKKMTRI